MNIVYATLVYAVWFLSTYYVVLFLIVLFTHKKDLYEQPPPYKGTPLVSVVVPAFNEERKIADTIASIKRITYPRLEAIVVNDGSTDETAAKIREAIGDDARFRFIDNPENKGKAACLNQAIAASKGRFIATMDADSVVDPDVFEKTLPYVADPQVGAVTITVEVKNPRSTLHRIIDMEFLVGLSLFLKALSFLNCIWVTPGPFSLYRRSTLRKIGGFDEASITEDLEIAYRITKAGYRIENCMNAKVVTIAPQTFKGIFVQRRRWYSGSVQTLVQHKGMILNKRYGLFGFLMPYTFVLIISGLAVFLMTLYLTVSNLLDDVLLLRYTGLDWTRIFEFRFDVLTLGGIFFTSITSVILSFVLVGVGLWLARKEPWGKRVGIMGFPLMFFLYQVFWIASFISVARGKKARWR